MRFGLWRGLAVLLVASGSARATDGLWPFHTIPREVPAKDFRTGDVMRAPAIPYGHYAKDYSGTVHGAFGHAAGFFHSCLGKCGLGGCGDGCGHGGCGDGGCGDGLCGKGGCGHGLFGHGGKAGCEGDGLCGGSCGGGGGAGGCGGGHALFKCGIGGLFSGCGSKVSGCDTCATTTAGVAHIGTTPSAQCASIPTAIPSAQIVGGPCGACGGAGHFGPGSSCGACGGSGILGKLLHHGNSGVVQASGCGSCGGAGCGLCGGLGGHGQFGHGAKDACGGCGGAGCGLCGGGHPFAGLKGHIHGKLGHFTKFLPGRGVKYFVGPGGPVPITPGYVPYVNPVRSPRDYFAFPPFGSGVQ
jgi:hypothetical protein